MANKSISFWELKLKVPFTVVYMSYSIDEYIKMALQKKSYAAVALLTLSKCQSSHTNILTKSLQSRRSAKAI